MKKFTLGLMIIGGAILTGCEPTDNVTALLPSGDVTSVTAEVNQAVLNTLPFDDRSDFDRAKRGFIATLDNAEISDTDGESVFNLPAYDFINQAAPASANPSLWRQSQLLYIHGLFKVTDRIYQVRNFDLANMTLIEGDTGWIIIDPLTSNETAKAGLDLANQHLGGRPVVAVIYTHSHADHFAGAKGVASSADVIAGNTQVIAPSGFMESVVSENILAGQAMTRRSTFMFGNVLPKNPTGTIGTGLGLTTAEGSVSLLAPTHVVESTGETMVIDGVDIVFQNTPGAEAPAEMMFYFPQFKALCLSEEVNGTMHNLYTPRGAQVRDGLGWSKYINETIELFAADTEVAFGSHHWPRWGGDEVLNYLKKQRDMYRFIHDQTLRMANAGMTPIEIAEELQLPASLDQEFFNRGYYGTVSHNVKAVYQRYFGWFDGNPANLEPLSPVASSVRYIEFMGGSEAVLEKARASFDEGDYRWVAQVVNHVVFAQPDNVKAKQLQADALEQLGFQAESGPWRNFYLAAASELRNGVVPSRTPDLANADFAQVMEIGMFFDAMAIKINPAKAEGVYLELNFNFTDINEQYSLVVENSTLNYVKDKQTQSAQTTLTMKKSDLINIGIGLASPAALLASGDIDISGNPLKLAKLFSMQEESDMWFNIVTP